MRVRNNSTVRRTISLPATGEHVSTPPIVIPANGGAVDVPDKVWDSVKGRTVVSAWLDEGILVTGRAPAQPKTQAEAPVQPEADVDVDTSTDEDEDGPAVDVIAAPEIADQMREAGMTVSTVAVSKPEQLTHLTGVGPAVARKLIEAAQAALG